MDGPGDQDTATNRRYWDRYADEYQREHAAVLARPQAWGTWSVPEADVGALGDVSGLDVLELGCGAAQWSIALAAAGARPVGLDASAGQLAHARVLVAARRGARPIPLVQATATSVPFADGSFDLVLSDHGAMSYADPDHTLGEVARVLRPSGRLVFSAFTPFTTVCWNEEGGRTDEALHRPYFGTRRWEDAAGFVSFELGYGEWIASLVRHGFVVEALHELRPDARATSSHHRAADRRWARRWPGEHIWSARRAP